MKYFLILIGILCQFKGLTSIELNSFIKNGTNAVIAPYHVHLLMRQTIESNQVFVRSGGLISVNFVVTVAINVESFVEWRIGVGSLNRKNLIYYDGADGITHPEFNPEIWNNNIGLIRSRVPIILCANIQTVNMPDPDFDPSPYENEFGKTTGFGLINKSGEFANNLKQASQRVIRTQDCINEYEHLETVISNFFCTFDRLHGSQICAGDQGAPMVDFSNQLVGLASFASNQCEGGQISVYVRLIVYRQWIKQITGV